MPRSQSNSAITLADVAERAKVSLMTASRALRDNPAVAVKTRRRVQTAARSLGYLPNLLARAFAQKYSPTIGVIVHDLSYPFFVPIIRAIEEAAAREGFLIVVGESKRALPIETQIVRRLRHFRVAGISLHPATPSFDHIDDAQRDGTPVVSFARHWRGGDSISVDNIDGGAQVARHLLKRGLNEIGLVTSTDPDNPPVLDRELGFIATLAEAGVSIPDRWRVAGADASFEEGQRAAELLFNQPARPRAVFCVNDRLSLGLINRSRQLGWHVPDDLAVIGFDDWPFVAYSEVPLTTMALPARRIGEDVAELLFSRIAGDGPRQIVQTALKAELIIRSSCP